VNPPSCAEVREAIDAALSGRGTAGAYTHPLGFIHITLPSPSSRKLRVHIWLPEAGSRQEESEIHNHGFAFASRVLTGVVEHQAFELQPHPARPDDRSLALVKVQPSQEVTHLVPTGRQIVVRPKQRMQVDAGDFYVFEAGSFHISRPATERLTVTAIACRKMEGVPSYVLQRAGKAGAWSPVEFGEGELRRLLLSVRALVAEPVEHA
jgi:hypothetical protein